MSDSLLSRPAHTNAPYEPWSRRAWLAVNTACLAGAVVPRRAAALASLGRTPPRAVRLAQQARLRAPGIAEALAQRAVDAARVAGATYASARLTRTVSHKYEFGDGALQLDTEFAGVGVQALVGGTWGFAASARWDADEVVRLARAAVTQASMRGRAASGAADMGRYPAATGHWATPVAIDPFTVPVEEKTDYLRYWEQCAARDELSVWVPDSFVSCSRQERVVATTDGTLVTQTIFETGGAMILTHPRHRVLAPLPGLTDTGQGWEFWLGAKIPERLPAMVDALIDADSARPAPIGRYTIVCDGATLASMLDVTLGVATQLDRALGYEANASGTSYLDDPLGMLGTLQVAAPNMTVTANRNAPTQLATVKWDDEGVEPKPFTLVKDGVLVDYQTTREQAAWLAPYYQKRGMPIQSHGCAAAEHAVRMTIQHPPNLGIEPAPNGPSLTDLIASVPNGILVTNGVAQSDFQGRGGIVTGTFHQIKNGRLAAALKGAAVQFDTTQFWKNISAIGGAGTVGHHSVTQYGALGMFGYPFLGGKGDPSQHASRTISGVAAVVPNQAVINPAARA